MPPRVPGPPGCSCMTIATFITLPPRTRSYHSTQGSAASFFTPTHRRSHLTSQWLQDLFLSLGKAAPLPLCPPSSISGIAYGSYARVLLSPILEQLENKEVSNTSVKATVRLEEDEVLLWQAVELAHSLVSQIKSHQER